VRGAWLIAAAALALAPAVSAQQVELKIDETLTVKGNEIRYGLDLGLKAVAPTRIGVAAMLDLTDLQHQLPELLAGLTLVDNCGSRIALQRIEADGREATVIVAARLDVEVFICERTAPDAWQRGALKSADEVEVRAELSAELRESCVVFRLYDVTPSLSGTLPEVQTGSEQRQAARALLVEAADLLLEDSPICPELPPELEMLDPVYESGAPSEIEEGGLGISLRGSIDVSTATILEVLRVLQARGVLPPQP
jgi:hypothetical protein